MDTAGPNKVIFHYDAAVDPNLVLSNISSLYILPEHVWGKYVGSNGKDLKTFRPENNLPLVSGGPFQITKYSKKGTTVFKPNPGYWGAPPHVEAVGLVYYTNSDSMIADLQGGTIDAVDQVPYTAVNARQEERRTGRQRRTSTASSRTSPGTRTRASRRTASCSIRRSRRRCRCASTGSRSSR